MATLERPEGLDHELPRAVLQRLIKSGLPQGVGISKDAKTAFGVATQIFVSYCTATANEISSEGKKKMLTAEDVLEAVKAMDFQEFVEPLTESLQSFREEQAEKKKRSKEKRDAEKKEAAVEAAAKAVALAEAQSLAEEESRKRVHNAIAEFEEDEAQKSKQARMEDDGNLEKSVEESAVEEVVSPADATEVPAAAEADAMAE